MKRQCFMISKAQRTFTVHHHHMRFFTETPKFHKFERVVREREIASIPSNDPVLGLINEVKLFVNEFNTQENMDEFFTRKSNQNVLSVLQCHIDDKYEYYRGRNIEVSLPSGSLCAERSAIGNATSNNLNLHRKHFRSIAVVDPDFNHIGIEPCGVCKEHLQKFQEESPEFVTVTFPDSEFTSIHEHFPANYPVEDVDMKKTQETLEKSWQCHCCQMVNSGYSTNCYHCGFAENEIQKKFSTMWRNPELTLKVVEVIYENYFPDKQFTHNDLVGRAEFEAERNGNAYCIIINNFLQSFAAQRRNILLKFKRAKEQNKTMKETFTTNPDVFEKYRNSLLQNMIKIR